MSSTERRHAVTRIGISGYEEKLAKKVDFFEIDFNALGSGPSPAQNVLVSLNQLFYRSEDPIPLPERIEIIGNRISNVRALGFTIRLVPSFFERHELEHQALPLQQGLEHAFGLPAWIDLPQSFPRHLGSDPRFILDPLWSEPRRGGCWKIHGWHETRWVRRYSDDELLRLEGLARKLRPELLLFGHSRRAEQCGEFMRMSKARLKRDRTLSSAD